MVQFSYFACFARSEIKHFFVPLPELYYSSGCARTAGSGGYSDGKGEKNRKEMAVFL